MRLYIQTFVFSKESSVCIFNCSKKDIKYVIIE